MERSSIGSRFEPMTDGLPVPYVTVLPGGTAGQKSVLSTCSLKQYSKCQLARGHRKAVRVPLTRNQTYYGFVNGILVIRVLSPLVTSALRLSRNRNLLNLVGFYSAIILQPRLLMYTYVVMNHINIKNCVGVITDIRIFTYKPELCRKQSHNNES